MRRTTLSRARSIDVGTPCVDASFAPAFSAAEPDDHDVLGSMTVFSDRYEVDFGELLAVHAAVRRAYAST